MTVSPNAATATDRRVRPWLAVGLALAVPGAGHLYLRAWVRALLWFGLHYTTFFLVVPPEARTIDELSMEALLATVEALPQVAIAAFITITALSVADAYWLAIRHNEREGVETGASCPNCGREVDEDIDFCHWCTTRFEDYATEDDQPEDEQPA